MSADEKQATCCEMRRKVTVFLGPVLPEEVCGISDTILADFMRFDLPDAEGPDGTKKAVLGFRFCPWCGKAFTASSETRTTAMFGGVAEDDESGEEWKKLDDEEETP
jgi:hypothetical protein